METKKRRVLIVRSASFQQLDAVLLSLAEFTAGAEVAILTHPQGEAIARDYGLFDQVYSYPHRKPFSLWRRVGVNRKFDDVLLLYANTTGHGYFNVILFALLSLKARRYWSVNSIGHFSRLSLGRLIAALGKRAVCASIALIGFALFLPVYALTPFLLWRARRGPAQKAGA